VAARIIGRMTLTHWPLSGLRLRTPRLEMRLPTLAELDELASLAAELRPPPGLTPFPPAPPAPQPPDCRS